MSIVHGGTLQLSPLAVLLGAEVAGLVGALGALPIAGAIGSWSSAGSEIGMRALPRLIPPEQAFTSFELGRTDFSR